MSAHVGLRLVERPREVEASLWRRLRFRGEAGCREHLFDLYLPFARGVARREHRRRPAYGLERSDFEQLAIRGLLEAIDRYDPLLGPPFAAFAKHRIRGAIADGVARSSESGAQYAFLRKLESERLQSLRPDAGEAKAPLAELTDIAAALAIGLLAEQAARNAESRDGPGYEGRAWRDLQQGVLEEIAELPEVERSIMQQHYFNGVAFTDIAKLLGLSKGRVSQLHRTAIQRVRARLRRLD